MKKKNALLHGCFIFYYISTTIMIFFSHLLKFDYGFKKIEFVLQREIPINDNLLKEKAADTIPFEYTN